MTVEDHLKMIKQIVSGMRYLENCKILHRDLSARNILVAEGNKLKISDLGMSRAVENYYSAKSQEIPIRWSAPEVLEYRKFSHASDVWSFGVCCWEILTNGKIPYNEYSNSEVVKEVLKGARLPQPTGCTDDLYKILLSCWQTEQTDRPTFERIYHVLAKIDPEEAPLEKSAALEKEALLEKETHPNQLYGKTPKSHIKKEESSSEEDSSSSSKKLYEDPNQPDTYGLFTFTNAEKELATIRNEKEDIIGHGSKHQPNVTDYGSLPTKESTIY